MGYGLSTAPLVDVEPLLPNLVNPPAELLNAESVCSALPDSIVDFA
jgi:hypothetical protein